MTGHSDMYNLNKQATAASEERLRALVAATSDVIYSLSADWEVMRELDGRGFLRDTDKPITGWKSRNVYTEDLKILSNVASQKLRHR